MTEYRITKYDPENRIDGKYALNEWTSMSDIGESFDDGVLTRDQYMQVEQNYVDCCLELLRKAGISQLMVCSPEYYDERTQLPDVLSEEEAIRKAIRCCLQEKCWAKLENKDFFIHFGYDYNMYVGTGLPAAVVQDTSRKYELFCEVKSSPYCI